MHTEVDDYGDTVPDECETDSEKQFEYLGTSLQMSILHNQERFDPLEYGDTKIVKESYLKH